MMGRIINEGILEVWKEKGYIESSEYVKSSEFTGQADYNLTLSGSAYGESSILLQILSGLTLLIFPPASPGE
jgi:ribosomal protein S8